MSRPSCVPCATDHGHMDKIWKFVANDDQPITGDLVGSFTEVKHNVDCKECSLKYGLTDVNAIWLPQYIRNTFYSSTEGDI